MAIGPDGVKDYHPDLRRVSLEHCTMIYRRSAIGPAICHMLPYAHVIAKSLHVFHIDGVDGVSVESDHSCRTIYFSLRITK